LSGRPRSSNVIHPIPPSSGSKVGLSEEGGLGADTDTDVGCGKDAGGSDA
jgi:hypothetical protein